MRAAVLTVTKASAHGQMAPCVASLQHLEMALCIDEQRKAWELMLLMLTGLDSSHCFFDLLQAWCVLVECTFKM